MTAQLAPAPIPTAAWLRDPLAEYRQGDFLMSGTAGSVLGRGTETLRMDASNSRDVLAAHFGAASQRPAIAGVLPFQPGKSGEFLVMDTTLRGPRLARPASKAGAVQGTSALGTASRGQRGGTPMAPQAADGHYTDAVAAALKKFSPSGLQKVVLARSRSAACRPRWTSPRCWHGCWDRTLRRMCLPPRCPATRRWWAQAPNC